MLPLVSVICLCYNHERFLLEALESVRNQTYPNVEMIVIDDASTDNSPRLLQQYAAAHPEVHLILSARNTGNCRAFNLALEKAKGAYIIDFATDDVMLPTRVAAQLQAFENLEPDYGIVYTDAELIGEDSRRLGYFYKRRANGQLRPAVAVGEVYVPVLERFFISSPTLMIRREVFDLLGGYDESLAYEDFDLMVRAARYFKFYFLDQPLTRRRLHPSQLSKRWYQVGDKQLQSTIRICGKALVLNRSERENQALARRVAWELKQAFFTRNHPEAGQLLALLKKLRPLSAGEQLLEKLNRARVNLSFVRRLYYQLKHR
ncbi:MAG: glycosyltransferase family 2 protein [Adhaeribacter sp.]